MFNLLFNPKKAEKHLWKMVIIAIFYATISIFVGVWIFPEYASLIAVFFTAISCLYVSQGAINNEEMKELYYSEKGLLIEHKKPLMLFIALFVGIVIAFSVWTYALPIEQANELFSIQGAVVDGIRESVSGNAYSVGEVFRIIFKNNLKVIFVSLIVALIYGAGAIFILTWNASIMGYVIGSIANQNGISSFPVAFLKYFLHGLPEMMSYFMAILAGGIIYASIVRGEFFCEIKTRKFIIDASVLVGLSIALMTFSALIEVFVSPFI